MFDQGRRLRGRGLLHGLMLTERCYIENEARSSVSMHFPGANECKRYAKCRKSFQQPSFLAEETRRRRVMADLYNEWFSSFTESAMPIKSCGGRGI